MELPLVMMNPVCMQTLMDEPAAPLSAVVRKSVQIMDVSLWAASFSELLRRSVVLTHPDREMERRLLAASLSISVMMLQLDEKTRSKGRKDMETKLRHKSLDLIIYVQYKILVPKQKMICPLGAGRWTSLRASSNNFYFSSLCSAACPGLDSGAEAAPGN